MRHVGLSVMVLCTLFVSSSFAQPMNAGNKPFYNPPQFPNISEVPDVTGDGIPDLLVGHQTHNGGTGIIYIHEGPVSTAGGMVPIPSTASGVILPHANIVSFGKRIERVYFDDGTDRPVVLIQAKAIVDGNLEPVNIIAEFYPDDNEVQLLLFNEPSSDAEFYTLSSFVFSWFDVPLPQNGLIDRSQTGGPYAKWQEEAPGFREILINNGIENLWGDFVGATFNAVSISNMYHKGWGWEGTGQRNAARHAIWMVRLTLLFGDEVAEELGDYHEEHSDQERDTAVDQYNNEVARQIAEMCSAEGEEEWQIINKVLQMIHDEDGVFITDPADDPRVDEILEGELVIADLEVVLN